jgi:hypothetical protein
MDGCRNSRNRPKMTGSSLESGLPSRNPDILNHRVMQGAEHGEEVGLRPGRAPTDLHFFYEYENCWSWPPQLVMGGGHSTSIGR